MEERIIELKDRPLEEQKEKGKKKNNEQSLRDLWCIQMYEHTQWESQEGIEQEE